MFTDVLQIDSAHPDRVTACNQVLTGPRHWEVEWDDGNDGQMVVRMNVGLVKMINLFLLMVEVDGKLPC